MWGPVKLYVKMPQYAGKSRILDSKMWHRPKLQIKFKKITEKILDPFKLFLLNKKFLLENLLQHHFEKDVRLTQ